MFFLLSFATKCKLHFSLSLLCQTTLHVNFQAKQLLFLNKKRKQGMNWNAFIDGEGMELKVERGY